MTPPLGLIWARRLRAGHATIDEILAQWPELSRNDVDRILAVIHMRYPQLANQRT